MALINLRNALMTGKRLPYDAEVEYLESTGTQYIDTGFKFSAPCKFILAANVVPVSSERDFFGAYKGTDVTGNIVCGIYNYFTFLYNRSPGLNDRIDSGVLQNIQQDIKVECTITSSARTLIVNENTYSDSHTNYFLEDTNITLFKGNINAKYYGKFRCYNFRIYNQNNNLVRDFIPVRKGTVGYLYDRVSGKLFGNAGTGDFVVGPDVVPVEYLQGCLGGYVDTGIKSLNTISTDISFGVVNPTHDGASGLGILLYGNGTTWAYNSYAIFFQNTPNQPDYKSLSSHGRNNILVRTPQNSFDCNVGVACDGTSTATVTTTYNGTTTSRSISISAIDGTKNFILLWNRNLYDNTVITRFKNAEFISGGATIAKFVPVRVGTDATSWEGAMMDVLTRRIYRNAGTGAFTYGNDLRYPIPAE